ncbi:DEAD-domain-containing protein [Ramaria rubella]|nr:DEAD-domain-containing protein [Ramaria rubella]
MEGRAPKRKLGSTSSTLSRKKPKRTLQISSSKRQNAAKSSSLSVAANVDELAWKKVRTQGDVGGFGDDAGGMLELEEVEGVEVVYGDTEGGKIVGFRVKESTEVVAAKNTEAESVNEDTVSSTGIAMDAFDGSFSTRHDVSLATATLLPEWAPYPLHAALLHSLHKRGFENPTAIQKRSLDELRQRDIVGIAETGSGKTLAYGLPILHRILTSLSTPTTTTITITPPPASTRRPLQALVLAPTRELALQVSEHLNACLDQLFAAQTPPSADGDHEKSKHRPPPPVSVAAIVGGMSAQKQRRILSRGVDILVATPGRFWDLCGEDVALSEQLRGLRFLVLDEADRMVEAGHFQELEGILRMTARPPPDMDMDAVEGVSQDPPAPAGVDTEVSQGRNDTMQTFVFSATMSKDLQRDLKRNGGRHKATRRKGENASTLDDLLMRLDFRDPDPVIIDLSPEGGRVQGLQESKVECLATDKDVYLYYFLLRHPGRSLVFLSSIDGIRRLMPLLELLNLNTWPLHSGLQQKQRLKNLDRRSTPNSVLLATDVAARGLDVPAVDHVIHYQVPRSADAYVHRNGRTARAMQKGFGLVLCAPDERRVFRGVLSGLGRDEDDVPELNVEHDILGKMKGRVQLARKIDSAAHRVKKEAHERSWMRETAEAMEIELDSDLESDASEANPTTSKKRFMDAKVKGLKAELKDALSRPLVARGVSARYITSGTTKIVDDLIEGANHETMLGLKKLEAGSEVVRKKKKKKKT